MYQDDTLQSGGKQRINFCSDSHHHIFEIQILEYLNLEGIF